MLNGTVWGIINCQRLHVGCANLSGPVELEQQACLAGKEVLAEVELCHAITAHHTTPGLSPSCLEDLGCVIPISLAT